MDVGGGGRPGEAEGDAPVGYGRIVTEGVRMVVDGEGGEGDCVGDATVLVGRVSVPPVKSMTAGNGVLNGTHKTDLKKL